MLFRSIEEIRKFINENGFTDRLTYDKDGKTIFHYQYIDLPNGKKYSFTDEDRDDLRRQVRLSMGNWEKDSKDGKLYQIGMKPLSVATTVAGSRMPDPIVITSGSQFGWGEIIPDEESDIEEET